MSVGEVAPAIPSAEAGVSARLPKLGVLFSHSKYVQNVVYPHQTPPGSGGR